jgi:arylsulfatase A-like enzyme
MNKKSIICSVSLLSAVAISCSEKQKLPERPNIIYILADDLGYGDVSANYPHGKITTPYIDRLASEGMRFTDAHSPSGVSTPTRYGIMTGNYCWRSRMKTGVLQGYGRSLMESGRHTVASLLKEEGYTTAVIGKWHLGLDWQLKDDRELVVDELAPRYKNGNFVSDLPSGIIDFSKPPQNGPLRFGFDYSFILPASLDMEPYCYLRNDTLTAPLTGFTEGNDLDTGFTGAFWRAGLMAEDFDFIDVLPAFTRQAVQYIQRSAESKQPFFLYFPMPAPHTPWLPTEEFAGRSGAGSYGDFVVMTDFMVGQLLEAVKNAGIEGNTMIILTSDNGPYWRPDMIEKYGHRAAGTYSGMKADAWDGGHRVPFIVKWPGRIKAGSVSNALTALTNLMATVSDIAGIAPGKLTCNDSYSILPVLLGKSKEVPNQKAIVHHSSRGHFAIRADEWKLIQGKGSGGFSTTPAEEALMTEEGQLYHMIDDPSETNNLYSIRKDIVDNLSKLLEDIKK